MKTQDKTHEANLKPYEKGQSMILIAIAMVALIGLLALVLDGGFAYAARRSAQNAADAGALAGANVLCGLQEGNAYDTAWDYAVTRNHADDAQIVIGSSVEVTATVTHDSFFAGFLGQDVVTVRAYAQAGCYNPCVSAILPIAWACKSPAMGEVDVNSCEIEYGTIDDLGPLYVIMDTPKAEEDYLCQDPPNSGLPVGALDCDLDDVLPYENDLMTGGGRSWLDLTAIGGGAAELRDYISGDVILTLPEHIWLLPNTGNKVTAFQEAVNRIGDIVSLPVFNDYSDNCNPSPLGATADCDYKWHPEDISADPDLSGGDWYHIISFSLFKVTGVWVNGQCRENDAGEGVCPATEYLQAAGILRSNENTIEGYFIQGYDEGMFGKCENNTGAITIYLDH